MAREGAVTNFTKFDAFVDMGVHQDRHVHISKLSTRYVKDRGEAVKAGQIVKVLVLSVDVKSKRIMLSWREQDPQDMNKPRLRWNKGGSAARAAL